MAYAFNALDNYFKRKKTDAPGGDLQKGAGAGAPPPTAAAESLAKSAETSDEQGNAAGRFAALKGAPTGAIAKRLAAPGEAQAKSWGEQSANTIDEYYRGGQTKIGATYKPVDYQAMGNVETGDKEATAKVGEQLGYTGKELTFEPLQITAPKLDTTSMLRSGISGIQAGLQKTGGRYTPGMAALDASAMAENPNAINQLQGQFGKTMQSARGVQARGAAVPGQLAKEAETTGTGIAGTVRGQLQSRIGSLQAAQQAAADAEAKRLEDESKKSAQGIAGIKNFASNEPVGTIAETGRATYTGEIDPRYSNLATILGIGNITAPEAGYGMWTGTAPVAPVAPPPDNRQTAGNTFVPDVPVPAGSLGLPEVEQTIKQNQAQITPEGVNKAATITTPPEVTAPGKLAAEIAPKILDPGGLIQGTVGAVGSLFGVGGSSGAARPRMPSQTASDIQTVFGANNNYGIDYTQKTEEFYKANGRWPTKQEMELYKTRGVWIAPKAPSAKSVMKKFW